MKDGLKNEYLNIFKIVDLTNKQDNLTYSLALLSNYERIKQLDISIVDFIDILASQNKELARAVIFKKIFEEPENIQQIIFNSILPYIKGIKDKNIDDVLQLAIIYEHIDEIDNAIEILNVFLLKYPENSRAYHELGHIFSDLGKYPQAIENMEKAINFGSKYYYCLEQIHEKAGDYNRAIEVMDKIPDAKRNAIFYHKLGHIHSKDKNDNEAIENMERAANLDPKYSDCLAKIYNQAEFTEKAIESYNEAIIYNSENDRVYHELGHIFLDLKKYPQAIENIEKAANLDPKYFDCLGNVCYVSENFEKAIESLNKSIDNDQDCAETYELLGSIYANKFYNYDKAINCWNKYLKMSSGSIDSKFNLLEALLGAGRYNEVNTYAIEILDISKNDEMNLIVRFIVLCSEFFDGKKNLKQSISEFIQHYNKLSENFDISWNYDGIINMMKKRDLSENDHNILISLIGLLEKSISVDEFKTIPMD